MFEAAVVSHLGSRGRLRMRQSFSEIKLRMVTISLILIVERSVNYIPGGERVVFPVHSASCPRLPHSSSSSGHSLVRGPKNEGRKQEAAMRC